MVLRHSTLLQVRLEFVEAFSKCEDILLERVGNQIKAEENKRKPGRCKDVEGMQHEGNRKHEQQKAD